MAKRTRPAVGNNDWLGNTAIRASLQIIGDDDKWHQLGTCLDTPNALAGELEKPVYKGQSIWVKTSLERRYYGQIAGKKQA
jgi:hypothetical protein